MSLQDQLLKAGLVNQHKAKQVKTQKRKQAKQKNKSADQTEAQRLAQEARVKQIEKDRQFNQQRNQESEKRQQANQIAQLIETNKLAHDEDGIPYRFTDENKVKALYVSETIRQKIISGRLAIVRAGQRYEVVASEVAEKIRQCDASVVVVLFDNSEQKSNDDEDDPYKDYQIPDDLMW